MIRYTYEPAEVPAGLAERLGVSPFAAEILFRRGIDSPEKLAGLRGLDPAPALAALRGLPGAAEATELLAGTLAAGRPIAVYHDYDADGVCAAAIALEVLSALGGDVFP